jgi:hypothetical protein
LSSSPLRCSTNETSENLENAKSLLTKAIQEILPTVKMQVLDCYLKQKAFCDLETKLDLESDLKGNHLSSLHWRPTKAGFLPQDFELNSLMLAKGVVSLNISPFNLQIKTTKAYLDYVHPPCFQTRESEALASNASISMKPQALQMTADMSELLESLRRVFQEH